MVTATDILVTAGVRDQVDRHAMAWFPRECCGLLVTGPKGHGAVLADNGLDEAVQAHSGHTRSAGQQGYLLDPREILRSERRGERLVAIFHSHCHVGAYFSDEDRRQALSPSNTPWFPDVEYVVLDAHPDGVKGYKVFQWSEAAEDFVQR